MLERSEGYSDEAVEFAVTASGDREYGKLQRLFRAEYIIRVDGHLL
jgi:hypothetical protein